MPILLSHSPIHHASWLPTNFFYFLLTSQISRRCKFLYIKLSKTQESKSTIFSPPSEEMLQKPNRYFLKILFHKNHLFKKVNRSIFVSVSKIFFFGFGFLNLIKEIKHYGLNQSPFVPLPNHSLHSLSNHNLKLVSILLIHKNLILKK